MQASPEKKEAEQPVEIAPVSALPVGKSARVELDGEQIALFNVDGYVYALADECLHMGASLSEGTVARRTVICPWHRRCYDLATGARVGRPGSPTRVYPVEIRDGWIVLYA